MNQNKSKKWFVKRRKGSPKGKPFLVGNITKPTTRVHILSPENSPELKFVLESKTLTLILSCVARQAKEDIKKRNKNSNAVELFQVLYAYLKMTDPEYLEEQERE